MDALRLVLRVRKSKDRESLYYYFSAKYFLPPTPQKKGYGQSGSAALPASVKDISGPAYLWAVAISHIWP